MFYPILTPIPAHCRSVMVFDVETNGLLPRDFKLENITPEMVSTLPNILQLSFVVYNIVSNRIMQSYNAYIRVSESVEISEFISNLTGITREVVRTKGKPIETVLNHFYQSYLKCDMAIAHNIDFDRNLIGIEIERHKDSLSNYRELRQLFTVPFNQLNGIELYCTMRASTNLCRLPKMVAPATATLETTTATLVPVTATLETVATLESTTVVELESVDPMNVKLAETAITKPKPKRNYTTHFKFPRLNELHQTLFGSIPENLHNSLVDVVVCLRCFLKIRCCFDIPEKSFVRMMRTAIEMSERTS